MPPEKNPTGARAALELVLRQLDDLTRANAGTPAGTVAACAAYNLRVNVLPELAHAAG
jgi:hypothetical protein